MTEHFRYPKSKQGQKTFQKIVETARKLFASQGYQVTSINEIITKSNIAAGTFYLYFKDKLAVYRYLLDVYRHNIRRTIFEAIQEQSSRKEKERLGIKAFLKYTWSDPLSYKIIWESMFIDYDLFKQYYDTFSKDYMRQLSAAGSEINSNIDTQTLSFMLMGIANFVGLQVLLRDTCTDKDLDYLTEQIMMILTHGMFE